MIHPPIRQTLDELGIPQRQFAELIDVDYKTVKRWVSGTNRTPLVVVLVLHALKEKRVTRRWIEKHCGPALVEKIPQ